MLEHDTCPGRADLSPWLCRGGGFARRRVSIVAAAAGEGSLGGCSAVPPPRTRCHQAQLGTSLGHQRVYIHGCSPFACRAVVCVRPSSSGPNPRDGIASFSRQIISLLNSVSLPYETYFGLGLRLSLSYRHRRFRVSSFHIVRFDLQSTMLARDYSRYMSLTQLCHGPYDVSLTLPTPCGDATLSKALSRRRNERRQARNSSEVQQGSYFSQRTPHDAYEL